MRFLHTSDWHLGRTLHGEDLIAAQRAVLQQICLLVADPIDGIAVDGVLIAGDIYDRAVPPVEAVTLFSETLAELARHTTVIVTAGNHDSAIRLGFGSSLFTDRVHIHTALTSVGQPVLLAGVAIYPLPYLDPDTARCVLATGGEPIVRSHQAVMSAAMARVRANLANQADGTRSVVMAHAFVVGGAASDSERSIAVGGVDSVAADTFEGVDYVALGHLHGAQQPATGSQTLLRYSGSPLRYSFSERDHTKSVTLVDLEPNGAVSVHAIRLEQPRAMAEICGTVDEVVSDAKHDSLAQAWLRITVTDRTRPDQMFTRVKSRFPHVLQVFHLPAGAAPAGVLTSREAREQDPRELGADFIFHVTGHRAVEAEVDLFEQAYQAAAQVASA